LIINIRSFGSRMKLLQALLALCAAAGCCASGSKNAQHHITSPDDQQLESHNLSEVIAKSPLLTLHRALCEIPSVTGNELTIDKLVISFLEAHNFTVTTQNVPAKDSDKKRLNIYAVPDLSRFNAYETNSKHTPKVLLTSHIDTVPPHIPYSLSQPKSSTSRKDILISGRGTVDDKACVAAQITTILDLLASPPKGLHPSDLALLFVVGEETIGDGMKHFSNSKLYEESRHEYKAILFGEPTELKLAAGHKGMAKLQLTARGKAAHSGYPWLGRSANSMILPALFSLDKLGDIPERQGGLPRSKMFGKSTVNVGYIRGGVAANVVPEYATADIAFRIAGGTKDEVRGIISRAVDAADPEGHLERDWGGMGYGPILLDHDIEGFETITVNYGTDVPNLEVGKGVKRYLYGPGSILVAHGRDEALRVGDMEEAVRGYKKLVEHVLDL
jgi:acetylornithine deacetylase